jgi:DNA-binding response OmpR family regulator
VSVQPSAAPPGVLVADDDEHIRFLLRLALRHAGFDPLLAADGREAVELFLRHKDEVGAVLLDVNMPGLDGPGALAQIRQADPAVPCCFMTGDPEPYDAEDLMALGAACILEKPFRIDEALETLRDLCGRPR